MLFKLSTDKSVAEAATALQAAVQANRLALCRFTISRRQWRRRAWSLLVNV
jgi:hypothetical protein